MEGKKSERTLKKTPNILLKSVHLLLHDTK